MRKGSKLGHPSPKKGIPTGISWNRGKKLHYTVWNKGKKGVQVSTRKGVKQKLHTQEWKDKMSIIIKKLGNTPPHFTGEKSSHWKGGITPKNTKIRTSIEYDLWKNSVFARDNWTDQKTGVRGCKLVAHHIQNFSQYPELRFAIDNGITLSVESHKEFHKKYGRKNNTRKQLEEFLTII